MARMDYNLMDPEPSVTPATVSIHHPQLRDLIQPSAEKGKVLYINRLKIEQADFVSKTQPASATYATLDFLANCLATGCGVLAAGGAQSELALRSLHSPSFSAASSESPSSQRSQGPWLLRTPTGGSINNAINITAADPSGMSNPSKSSKGRSSAVRDAEEDVPAVRAAWTDEILDHGGLDDPMDLDDGWDELVGPAYGFINSSSRQWESAKSSSSNRIVPPQIATKIMISNNDCSIKAYRLRPPPSPSKSDDKTGLPGLTMLCKIHYPTAINHSSFSPDGRTLLSVGDTPEVFLHHQHRSGQFHKIACYTASSDASFSTAWHPDGTKFAVASQDGIVSIWDVRSSAKLASISTSQASQASGAARVVKWSPRGDLLAFTEHRNYFHVVDTISFTEQQRIALPPASTAPQSSTMTLRYDVEQNGSIRNERRSSGPTFGAAGSYGPSVHPWSALPLPSSGSASGRRETERARHEDVALGSSTDDVAIASADRSTQPRERQDSWSHEGWTLGVDDDSDMNSTLPPSLRLPFTLVGSDADTLAAGTGFQEALPIFRGSRLGALTRSAGGSTPWSSRQSEDNQLSRTSSSVDISGLCWDPDGDAIYCGTDRIIARYRIAEPRRSFGASSLL